MRDRTIAIGLALLAIGLCPPQPAVAQGASGLHQAQAASPGVAASDVSAQRRAARRPPTRLRVYPIYRPQPYEVVPRYNPGPNAVRDCTATYVEEYRPSGTVITPRMNCFWRRG
ncbi:MAG TPA: hypothetical protein VGC77_23380 [Rhodopseudomonas sp.]|uniref:hypothetical protein n=1 Tax=Rhodopseudomonas sp. TaxID=1078 RepID=UPI002EDBA63C